MKNRLNIIAYQKERKEFARKLRQDMTYSERIFWNAVRKSQLGFTFIRQKPIGYYIYDFYCRELKLVVEIDGDSHLLKEVKENDLRKDEYALGLGLKLLRFTDDEVISDMKSVRNKINLYIETQTPPQSPPQGREIAQ